MLLIVFNIWVFFKNSNACGLPDHNGTWHNKKEHETQEWQGRHTNHGSVKCIHWSYRQKSSIALRQVKDDIDHIHDEYLTCVCVRFCIGSLIKPPNHVCVSNTEILILKMNILVKRRTFLLFLILSVFKCCDSKVASLWIWSWYGCLIIVLSKIKDL